MEFRAKRSIEGLGVSGGFDRRSPTLGRENLQACLSEVRPVFRFTIRDVLWLTILVAVLVAWWIDHSRQRETIERLSGPWTGFQWTY
jgi:hypothetical protein